MFSIVCFVGLFLMAIGASSAEVEDTHIQTLSANGRLYSLPSTTQIQLDDQAAMLAAVTEPVPAPPVNGNARSQTDAAVDPAGSVPADSSVAGKLAIGSLPLLGRRFTITADTVLAGTRNMDASAVGDAVISAGLVDADARLYVDLDQRHAAQDDANPPVGSLRGPVENIAPPMLTVRGVLIDAGDAAFLDGDGRPMTAREFFADLRLDQMVSVNDAVLPPGTDVLRAGEVVALAHDGRAGDWWAARSVETG